MKKEMMIRESKSFCILPWIHAHVLPTSEVIPCCVWPYDDSFGSLKDKSLKELTNNERYVDLRKRMLAGETIEGCHQCYERDNAGGTSLRKTSNSNFAHYFKEIVKPTLKDGILKEFKMVYFDVRFSNICNFKCRGCSPELSSSWYSDYEKLYDFKSNRQKLISIMPNKNLWNEFITLIPTIEEAYFAGGEPLIMDEHYLMLEEFIKAGKTDIRLSYNSNMSNLRFRDKLITDYWQHFKQIFVGISIDDYGARGEYFRHGLSWKELLENINHVKKECPHVYFSVNCTVSLFNVYYLPEIHLKLMKEGVIRLGDLIFNLLLNPVEYKVQVLPRNFREKIVKKLNDFVKRMTVLYKEQDPVGISRLLDSYNSVIKFLLEEDHEDLKNELIKRNRKLDEIRREDFKKTFPELAFMYEEM